MPTVYGIGISPFVRKVRVSLAEKGLTYDHDPVIPVNVSPEYRKISPQFVNLFHVGYGVETHPWPKLAAYLAAIHERPSFKALISKERAMLGA